MNPVSTKKPVWILLGKTADGKEVEVGRFVTDFLAREYAETYKIKDWRIKGPKGA